VKQPPSLLPYLLNNTLRQLRKELGQKVVEIKFNFTVKIQSDYFSPIVVVNSPFALQARGSNFFPYFPYQIFDILII
jgi:hypothetical protein